MKYLILIGMCILILTGCNEPNARINHPDLACEKIGYNARVFEYNRNYCYNETEAQEVLMHCQAPDGLLLKPITSCVAIPVKLIK